MTPLCQRPTIHWLRDPAEYTPAQRQRAQLLLMALGAWHLYVFEEPR